MEKIKPKKERKFLKAVGNIAKVLANELVMGIARKFIGKAIDKVGNKRQSLVLAFIILASTFAIAQYPTTGNKQRLGYQTTGDGLVYRGRATDTLAIKSSGLNNAYFILDTVNNIQYNYIKTKGGWVFSNGDTIIINNNFTQPVDSLFFNVNVPTNNVDTAKMRWDSDLATVVLGLNDNVPNELGFKNFWLVKNQTGATITKGSLVYANGTVGASGRITVAKFIANGSIDAKYLLGITAHDLTDGEDGYVISFGKIRQINTDTFAAGAILYPSPTVAGFWTDVEPVAPNIDMPIGFCINSSVNNGTIAIRVASGYKLSELHDLSITSPIESSSLYYKGGLWRDTTPTLLVSDTASMLTNYLRSGVAASTYQAKLNGTGFVKANGATISYDNSTYLTTGTASSTYLPLIGGTVSGTINRQEGSNDGSASTFYYNILNYFAKRDNNKGNQTAQITFTDRPGTATFENNVRTSDIYLMTAKNFSGGQLGQYLDTTLSVVANQDGGRIGISKLNPAYKLDVNGTLGVTGATTLSAPLTVNSSAVFNEGSTDSDFRVESDGNVNMVFVDASTDRVGIGTASPTRTLEVNGTVNATGDITENGLNVLTSADTVSLSNRINLKFNSSGGTISGFTNINATLNVVNDGAVGGTFQVGGITQLSNLAGTGTRMVVASSTGILSTQSVTERFYFDLGIVAGAADNSASTYDFSYGNNIFIVPKSLNGYCIDTVYIRAIGCSTCPPVAGDKDYYVGVYKANAGARVATAGASLQGSQITMNEYDLNEVNANYILSTGEAWWVYLNGTYTSDMAYVTAGFIVKKTCN